MTRLTSAMKTDFRIQVRNRLYIIGPVVAVFMGLVISQLAGANDLVRAVPVVVLLVIGGTGLLYVGGLVIFEKDEGTLNAVTVSPLRTSEYLLSKVLTLSVLALFEGVILNGVAVFIISRSQPLAPVNVPLLLAGILVVNLVNTLVGVAIIARFDSLTDALVPLIAVGTFLQFPFLYFLELWPSPLLLAVPTGAPAMLMQGAFRPLEAWEWAYGIGYSLVALAALGYWAYHAFRNQLTMKME